MSTGASIATAGDLSTRSAPLAALVQDSKRPFAFWMLMAFFVLEYIRPEFVIELKLQMICLVLFPILWFAEVGRQWSGNLTLQMAFVGLCALSVPFASNNFAAYYVTRILYGHVVIALTITWLLANRQNFVFAIWFWVLMMAYQATYGLMHAGRGTGGFLGDENDLALGLNTALPFALLGLRSFRGWRRWASGALAVLFLAGVVASGSRGGFVGLVAVAIYYTFAGRHRIRNLLIGLVGAGVFFFAIPDEYKQEIESIQEVDSGTAENRFFLWTAATNMWLDHPIFGVGAGNSSWQMGRYQPEGTKTGLFSGRQFHERDWTMRQTHSLYFQVLAETGIAGCLILGSILVGHFTGLQRLRRRVVPDTSAPLEVRNQVEFYTVALRAAMVGYLVTGVFLSVAYYPYLWYFTALAVAWARAVEAELSDSRRRVA